MTIYSHKLKYYQELDLSALKIAQDLTSKKDVSVAIMQVIIDLYKAAKVEQQFVAEQKFESAYHSPITSELEFFISRILFHYSDVNKLGWKILLRRQVKKTAPDIRIERDGKTYAIIEIKAKAGWIQPFLSKDRYDYDVQRLLDKKSKFNPDDLIKASKAQLEKYMQTFNVEVGNIFFLLPTLILVHRKRYEKELYEYTEYFSKTSGLPSDNLILLSKNMRLDLSNVSDNGKLDATKSFEYMIFRLHKDLKL